LQPRTVPRDGTSQELFGLLLNRKSAKIFQAGLLHAFGAHRGGRRYGRFGAARSRVAKSGGAQHDEPEKSNPPGKEY
jgi:hypothetical protein